MRVLKRIGLICSLLLALAVPVWTSGSASAEETAKPTNEIVFEDFTYENFEKNKKFIMKVPKEWTIMKDFQGNELFMRPKVRQLPTKENPIVADPNITVKMLRKEFFIDEIQLEEYGEEVRKGIEESQPGSEPNVFNKFIHDFGDGRKYLIYYVTFKPSGNEFYSMVAVTADAQFMYKITITDYRVNFDLHREKFAPLITSLTISGLPSVRPNPFEKYIVVGGSLFGLMVVIILMRTITLQKQRRMIRHVIATGKKDKGNHNKPPVDFPPNSMFADISQAQSSYADPSAVELSQYHSQQNFEASPKAKGTVTAAPQSEVAPSSEFAGGESPQKKRFGFGKGFRSASPRTKKAEPAPESGVPDFVGDKHALKAKKNEVPPMSEFDSHASKED